MPGLALLLHLADGGHGAISATAMARALAWAHYLRSHAMRAYGSVIKANATAARALLTRIRRGDVQDGFTVREVWKKGWSKLTTSADVEAAVTMLVEYGWISPAVTQTGGRPRVAYSIHPEVRP